MRHVPLVPHEALGTVIAPEREVSCVATLVSHQLVSVTELFLTIVTGVSRIGTNISVTLDENCYCSPFSVFVNPGVLGEMLSLGKGLVTNLTDEGLVEGPRTGLGGATAGGAHLVLDDGGGLAERVPLTLGLDLGRGHAGDLHRDAVALGVPLPHGVRVVEDQVGVGQLGRHPHQLQGVRVDLEAVPGPRGHGRHRDDRGLGGRGRGRAAARFLGDGNSCPVLGCVILNGGSGDRHVDIIRYLS